MSGPRAGRWRSGCTGSPACRWRRCSAGRAAAQSTTIWSQRRLPPLRSPTMTTTTPASAIWFTDRSRVKLGLGRCPRARYLGYHAGPSGYGITLRRESLPLATGLSVHEALERFAHILQREDRLPTLAEVRDIILTVCAAYVKRVEERGYRGILGKIGRAHV